MTDWKALCEELLAALQEVHDDIIDNGISWISLESQQAMKRAYDALYQDDTTS